MSDVKCLIEGCEKPAVSRKLCIYHYDQWRYGTISNPELGEFKRILPKRKPPVNKVAIPSKKVKPAPPVVPDDLILTIFSEKLQQAQTLADALTLLDQGKKAKDFIKTFLGGYFD